MIFEKKKRKKIPGSRILVEKSSSVNSGQNWALHSLPNPVPMVGAEGYERNVCSCQKWRPLTWLPWTFGEGRSTEVDGRISTVFLDSMEIDRSLMWQVQERNLYLTQRWAQVHLHMGKSHSWNLHWPLSLSHYHVPGWDNRNQSRTENPWRGLSLVYNCPHTLSKFPTENSIFHLIK